MYANYINYLMYIYNRPNVRTTIVSTAAPNRDSGRKTDLFMSANRWHNWERNPGFLFHLTSVVLKERYLQMSNGNLCDVKMTSDLIGHGTSRSHG